MPLPVITSPQRNRLTVPWRLPGSGAATRYCLRAAPNLAARAFGSSILVAEVGYGTFAGSPAGLHAHDAQGWYPASMSWV
jgi:hypothetical protein